MKVMCEHCGVPFSVSRLASGKAVYCCSGCALAARISVDANGRLPVNAALVSALGAGFVFFNQALLWMLALLLSRRADAEGAIHAGRFVSASLALGAALCVGLVLFQIKAGAWSASNGALFGTSGLAVGWGISQGRPEMALAGNVVLAAWALRGLARKKVSQKNRSKEGVGS
jgi:hypothetical protein